MKREDFEKASDIFRALEVEEQNLNALQKVREKLDANALGIEKNKNVYIRSSQDSYNGRTLFKLPVDCLPDFVAFLEQRIQVRIKALKAQAEAL